MKPEVQRARRSVKWAEFEAIGIGIALGAAMTIVVYAAVERHRPAPSRAVSLPACALGEAMRVTNSGTWECVFDGDLSRPATKFRALEIRDGTSAVVRYLTVPGNWTMGDASAGPIAVPSGRTSISGADTITLNLIADVHYSAARRASKSSIEPRKAGALTAAALSRSASIQRCP